LVAGVNEQIWNKICHYHKQPHIPIWLHHCDGLVKTIEIDISFDNFGVWMQKILKGQNIMGPSIRTALKRETTSARHVSASQWPAADAAVCRYVRAGWLATRHTAACTRVRAREPCGRWPGPPGGRRLVAGRKSAGWLGQLALSQQFLL
jgi:hypothetical protein